MKVADKKARRLDAGLISKTSGHLRDEDVREFLKQHPDFLSRNPEVVASLSPPSKHGEADDADGQGGIVDFHKFQIERLQEFLAELDAYQDRLIAATRSNLANQQRIHEASLAALDAEGIEELIHIATHDWRDMLDVDVVGLALVIPEDDPLARELEITPVRADWIDGILGFDDAAIFRDTVVVGDKLFGPAAPLVRAEAVARLGGSGPTPEGLLAFGTRDAAGFYPGQGTELLRFLTRILDHCLGRWMSEQS